MEAAAAIFQSEPAGQGIAGGRILPACFVPGPGVAPRDLAIEGL